MARHVLAALHDMETAIDGIEASIRGLTLEAFKANWVVRHAVQRGLEIISEASRNLPPELTDPFPLVPWRQVRDIGNVLRHGYHGVDDGLIWLIASHQLQTLRHAIDGMRERSTGSDP